MQYYYHSTYSAHYAQAYAQYTQSPTPGPHTQSSSPPQVISHVSQPQLHAPNYHQMSSWYQSGSSRCTHSGCSFVGSQKSVEIHMMDRHLIYPPGWDKRKRKSDWDADPSLKGKSIPIQGTNLVLDTPEMLEAWLAERKRRWPSKVRVEEKQRKLNEAVARGQIIPVNSSFRERKRRRLMEQANNSAYFQARHKLSNVPRIVHPLPRNPLVHEAASSSQPIRDQVEKLETCSADEDEDSAPEVVSSKDPRSSMQETQAATKGLMPTVLPTAMGSRHKQPMKPLRNPFDSRPPLLRSLLLPEIRVTISNLSQAIRFLVDNNFLENVELTPGETERRLIEEVSPIEYTL